MILGPLSRMILICSERSHRCSNGESARLVRAFIRRDPLRLSPTLALPGIMNNSKVFAFPAAPAELITDARIEEPEMSGPRCWLRRKRKRERGRREFNCVR